MFKVSSVVHLLVCFFKFPSSVASVQVERDADKFLNIISNKNKMDFFFHWNPDTSQTQYYFLYEKILQKNSTKIQEHICTTGKQLLKEPVCISSPQTTQLLSTWHPSLVVQTSTSVPRVKKPNGWRAFSSCWNAVSSQQTSWKEGFTWLFSHWE